MPKDLLKKPVDLLEPAEKEEEKAVLPVVEVTVPVPEVTVNVPAPEQPTKASPDAKLVSKSVKDASDRTAAIISLLAKEISNIKFESPEPIREWSFKVIRGDDDLIDVVTAKAIK